MARRSNTIQSVQITVSTTARIRDLLEVLAESGMYGKNPAEVATTLLQQSVRDLVAGGDFKALMRETDELLGTVRSTSPAES